ncbi:MAG: hypothetical protein ACI9S8_003066 [Chlamydiales bacterium]|jgi:hypothetical protein
MNSHITNRGLTRAYQANSKTPLGLESGATIQNPEILRKLEKETKPKGLGKAHRSKLKRFVAILDKIGGETDRFVDRKFSQPLNNLTNCWNKLGMKNSKGEKRGLFARGTVSGVKIAIGTPFRLVIGSVRFGYNVLGVLSRSCVHPKRARKEMGDFLQAVGRAIIKPSFYVKVGAGMGAGGLTNFLTTGSPVGMIIGCFGATLWTAGLVAGLVKVAREKDISSMEGGKETKKNKYQEFGKKTLEETFSGACKGFFIAICLKPFVIDPLFGSASDSTVNIAEGSELFEEVATEVGQVESTDQFVSGNQGNEPA